jgi:hypothetical protein
MAEGQQGHPSPSPAPRAVSEPLLSERFSRELKYLFPDKKKIENVLTMNQKSSEYSVHRHVHQPKLLEPICYMKGEVSPAPKAPVAVQEDERFDGVDDEVPVGGEGQQRSSPGQFQSTPSKGLPFLMNMDGPGMKDGKSRRLLRELTVGSPTTPPPMEEPLDGERKGKGRQGSVERKSNHLVSTSPSPGPTQGMFLSKLSSEHISGPLSVNSNSSTSLRAAEDAVERRARLKLIAPMSKVANHSPATFMGDITQFVQAELSALDTRFPDERGHATFSPPLHTSLLPADLALRDSNCAPETREEMKRRLRLGIFSTAQRMFADSFKSYKLFLDAIADEHQSYYQFLLDDLRLHKEVVAGVKKEMERTRQAAAEEVRKAKQEKAEILELLEAERLKHKKLRMAHAEQAMKDKTLENDVRRHMLELEQSNATLREEVKHLTSELDAYKRQVEALSLSTFSDALETVNNQLMEWKTQAAAKETQVHEAHDQVADLLKDLKHVANHFNGILDFDHQLKPEHVRLSALGLRALFPEVAAVKRKSLLAQQAADAAAATSSAPSPTNLPPKRSSTTGPKPAVASSEQEATNDDGEVQRPFSPPLALFGTPVSKASPTEAFPAEPVTGGPGEVEATAILPPPNSTPNTRAPSLASTTGRLTPPPQPQLGPTGSSGIKQKKNSLMTSIESHTLASFLLSNGSSAKSLPATE